MQEIQVGDVVYCEGASAILGDVTETSEDGVTVVWRQTTTFEQADDLVLEARPDVKTDERGIEYVERGELETLPKGWALCGTCGRAWNDAKPTAWTPAPSGRCPFEYDHEDA